jgi:hypothetical protein
MLPLLGASLGAAYTLAGRLGEAILLLERTVRDGVAMQRMGGHSILVVRLGEAYLKAGRSADALDAAEHAVRLARRHKERGHEAYALRLLGDVAAQDKPVDVERAESFGQAAAVSEQLGCAAPGALPARFRRLYLRSGRLTRRGEASCGGLYRALGMSFWRRHAFRKISTRDVLIPPAGASSRPRFPGRPARTTRPVAGSRLHRLERVAPQVPVMPCARRPRFAGPAASCWPRPSLSTSFQSPVLLS